MIDVLDALESNDYYLQTGKTGPGTKLAEGVSVLLGVWLLCMWEINSTFYALIIYIIGNKNN